MPSNITLDPFRRFRFRSPPAPTLPSSPEEDSDDSSPERNRPRAIIHLSSPKNTPRSGEHLLSIPEDAKLSHSGSQRLSDSAPIALTFDKPPHASHPERPSKRPSKPLAAGDPVDALQPPTKSTLIRRVTSKLIISIPSRSGSHALRSRPSARTLPLPSSHEPRSPKPVTMAPPTLPNSIASKEKREAALRERGLRPPCKDLSVQEREADERLASIPPPASVTVDGATEAELLKASWLASNRTSWCGDSDCGPSTSRNSQGLGSRPHSMLVLPSSAAPSPDMDAVRRSSEGKTDLASFGRPSMGSSVPPLSPSSYLEVLHEDPAEQGPITPLPLVMQVPLPIVVTSPMEYPPSSVLVESPISCSFSSHCPGSTLESQSQSDHRSMAEKDSMGSRPRRTRTSDSYERQKVTGSSLTRLKSLSNLRRSVAGSLGIPSSSTLSSADLPARAAISPTMHSIGSIIRETRDIADAESRRLSELAFLD